MKNLTKLSKEEINESYSKIENVFKKQASGFKLESLDKLNNFIHIKNGGEEVIGTLNIATQKIYGKSSNHQDKLGIISYFIGEEFGERWEYEKGVGFY